MILTLQTFSGNLATFVAKAVLKLHFLHILSLYFEARKYLHFQKIKYLKCFFPSKTKNGLESPIYKVSGFFFSNPPGLGLEMYLNILKIFFQTKLLETDTE